jgi:hypothetical protein
MFKSSLAWRLSTDRRPSQWVTWGEERWTDRDYVATVEEWVGRSSNGGWCGKGGFAKISRGSEGFREELMDALFKREYRGAQG